MIQPNPSLGPFYTYAGSGVLPCASFHLPTVQKTAALVHHEQAHSTLDAKKWLHRLPPDAQQGRSSQAPGIAVLLAPGVWRKLHYRQVNGLIFDDFGQSTFFGTLS